MSLFFNFNKPMTHLEELKEKEVPLEDFNPLCVDFAPFLSKHFVEPLTLKTDAKLDTKTE